MKFINKMRRRRTFVYIMKAAIFEKLGLENLKIVDNAEEPKASDHEVLIKVKAAGVNPIDSLVISGSLPKINQSTHTRSRVKWYNKTSWKSC